jgi:Protein of unknown function (DUF2852)
MEDEQREFRDFLARLRQAKDKAEFDQFAGPAAAPEHQAVALGWTSRSMLRIFLIYPVRRSQPLVREPPPICGRPATRTPELLRGDQPWQQRQAGFLRRAFLMVMAELP